MTRFATRIALSGTMESPARSVLGTGIRRQLLLGASVLVLAVTFDAAVTLPAAQAQFVCGGSATGAEHPRRRRCNGDGHWRQPIQPAARMPMPAGAGAGTSNTAVGTGANASGDGSRNTATGSGAQAFGFDGDNTATGNNAFAFGNDSANTATGASSNASGTDANLDGTGSSIPRSASRQRQRRRSASIPQPALAPTPAAPMPTLTEGQLKYRNRASSPTPAATTALTPQPGNSPTPAATSAATSPPAICQRQRHRQPQYRNRTAANASGIDSRNTATGVEANASGGNSNNIATGSGPTPAATISSNIASGLQADASGFRSGNVATGEAANASGSDANDAATGWPTPRSACRQCQRRRQRQYRDGRRANASGDNATNMAIGAGATASGNGMAVGTGAFAAGPGDVAVGQGATVAADNGSAYRRGRDRRRRPHQCGGVRRGRHHERTQISRCSALEHHLHHAGHHLVSQPLAAIGTDGVVTTDANGNLASDNGSTFRQIDENQSGVAMAIAMQNPDLTGDERFGVAANWGTFEERQRARRGTDGRARPQFPDAERQGVRFGRVRRGLRGGPGRRRLWRARRLAMDALSARTR